MNARGEGHLNLGNIHIKSVTIRVGLPRIVPRRYRTGAWASGFRSSRLWVSIHQFRHIHLRISCGSSYLNPILVQVIIIRNFHVAPATSQPASFRSPTTLNPANYPAFFKMIVTELTKILGIRVPVVQGGMQWVRPSASLPLLYQLTCPGWLAISGCRSIRRRWSSMQIVCSICCRTFSDFSAISCRASSLPFHSPIPRLFDKRSGKLGK